jgi:HEAT repeat protein
MSLETLLNALTAPRWQDRVAAVNQLAKIDDERARNALTWALYDDDDDAVVEAAAQFMLSSGDMRWVEPLVEAIGNAEDHKGDVIWSCVSELGGGPVADEVWRRLSDSTEGDDRSISW